MPTPLPTDEVREAYERGRVEALQGFEKAMENAITEVRLPKPLKKTIMMMVKLSIKIELSAQKFYREKRDASG